MKMKVKELFKKFGIVTSSACEVYDVIKDGIVNSWWIYSWYDFPYHVYLHFIIKIHKRFKCFYVQKSRHDSYGGWHNCKIHHYFFENLENTSSLQKLMGSLTYASKKGTITEKHLSKEIEKLLIVNRLTKNDKQ